MHATESCVNLATGTYEKTVHETVDWLVVMILELFDHGHTPATGKRDFTKAFRSVPICKDHWQWAWVIMYHEDKRFMVQFWGMYFGCTAAVFAFHRVGALLALIVRKLMKAPLARYVGLRYLL